MQITIKSDGVLEKIADNIGKLPSWTPAIFRTYLPPLGNRVVKEMRDAVEENRYTGSLSDSIQSQYNDADYSVTIRPTVKRGAYDGGAILELGTKPIPNCPWMPIKKWAEFRGLPAFPIWYSIRMHGVKAHPFVRRTYDSSENMIKETAQRIAQDEAVSILYGYGTVSVPSVSA